MAGGLVKSPTEASCTYRFYLLMIVVLPCTFLALFYFLPVINVLLFSVTEPKPGLQNYQTVTTCTLGPMFSEAAGEGASTTTSGPPEKSSTACSLRDKSCHRQRASC